MGHFSRFYRRRRHHHRVFILESAVGPSAGKTILKTIYFLHSITLYRIIGLQINFHMVNFIAAYNMIRLFILPHSVLFLFYFFVHCAIVMNKYNRWRLCANELKWNKFIHIWYSVWQTNDNNNNNHNETRNLLKNFTGRDFSTVTFKQKPTELPSTNYTNTNINSTFTFV